jgi:hypothetical protein
LHKTENNKAEIKSLTAFSLTAPEAIFNSVVGEEGKMR